MTLVVSELLRMTPQDWIDPQEEFNPDTQRSIGFMTAEEKNLFSLWQRYSLLADQPEDPDDDACFSQEVKFGMAADIFLDMLFLEIIEHFDLEGCNKPLVFLKGWQVAEVLVEDSPMTFPSLGMDETSLYLC